MAYDEDLAERVRALAAERPDTDERRMFGGLAFMVGGNMGCCVLESDLLVRLPPDEVEAALREPGTSSFGMSGKRPMRGFVRVDGSALTDDAALASWFDSGATHAASLPPK